jgi:hypothetical protein
MLSVCLQRVGHAIVSSLRMLCYCCHTLLLSFTDSYFTQGIGLKLATFLFVFIIQPSYYLTLKLYVNLLLNILKMCLSV